MNCRVVEKLNRPGSETSTTSSPPSLFPAKRGAVFQKPMAVKLGVFRPITVYPLYESATSAHWGQTPREALAESGALWSTYARVASENENSWMKKRLTPDEIDAAHVAMWLRRAPELDGVDARDVHPEHRIDPAAAEDALSWLAARGRPGSHATSRSWTARRTP